MAQQQKTVKLAVIGMPGQGKSTLLNALAGNADNDLFPTATGSESCTKEVSQRTKLATDDLAITLVDTMGFPDPEKKEAERMYNEVVAACNQDLDAIIWVHQNSREFWGTIEACQVLLREFNKAQPPIYLVINGTLNYPRKMSEDAKEEARKEALIKNRVLGQELAQKACVSVAHILAGADIDDLFESITTELGLLLMNTTPKKSNMKTAQMLKEELKRCKSENEKAQHEMEKKREEKEKAQKDLQTMQQTRSALEIAASTTTASAVGLFFVPFAGPALGAAALVAGAALAASAAAMKGSIDKGVKGVEANIKELDAAVKNKSMALKAFETSQMLFAALFEQLTGKKG